MRIPLKEYFQLLMKYLKPQWLFSIVMAICLFVSVILHVLGPQVTRLFIDGIQQQAADRYLFYIALLYIAVGIGQQVFINLGNFISMHVGWKATNALRTDLARHCLHLDLSFHNKHTPGEMIERIDGDVSTLSGFFSQLIFQVIYCILFLGGVMTALFLVDWRVGTVLTFFSLVAFIILSRLQNIAVPYWDKERQASAELFGFLEERIQGTEDIRANGAIAYALNRFYSLVRALMHNNIKASLMVNIQVNTIEVFFTIGSMLGFMIGAYLFRGTAISLGTLFVITSYCNMLEWPIKNLANQMQDLQRASAGIKRIKEFFAVKSMLGEPPAAERRCALPRLNPGPLQVRFDGVSFRYKDAESGAAENLPVLQDISFELAPGKVLGLLGRTGSGKTSLSRLLFRFYDPDAGCIYLGNESSQYNLQQIAADNLKTSIGLVTQNVQLFHASVRDNLTFFDPGIPDERILAVFRELGLWPWYQSLDKGLDTELEASGAGLSAGEAQLLTFSRIFLRNPGLVILDEASSRLDPATEHMIEKAIDLLVRNRTAIIIAHRLQTVHRADEVLILDQGRIIEYGTRQKLAADPGSCFAGLLKTGLEEVLV